MQTFLKISLGLAFGGAVVATGISRTYHVSHELKEDRAVAEDVGLSDLPELSRTDPVFPFATAASYPVFAKEKHCDGPNGWNALFDRRLAKYGWQVVWENHQAMKINCG